MSAVGEPSDPVDARPPSRRPLLIGGAVAAAVVGAVVAYAAFAPESPAPEGPGQMHITINPAKPPPPLPKSHGKLDVLPQDMAAAADPALPPPPAAAELPAMAPPVEPAPPAPVAAVRPSFECAGQLSRAQIMVCEDPALAAADRRMARAYAQAVAAGVPTEALRADQAEWRSIREDAAYHSPGAVAQVYAERTAELEDIAAHGYDGE